MAKINRDFDDEAMIAKLIQWGWLDVKKPTQFSAIELDHDGDPTIATVTLRWYVESAEADELLEAGAHLSPDPS